LAAVCLLLLLLLLLLLVAATAAAAKVHRKALQGPGLERAHPARVQLARQVQ
jgi:hypothetical protein